MLLGLTCLDLGGGDGHARAHSFDPVGNLVGKDSAGRMRDAVISEFDRFGRDSGALFRALAELFFYDDALHEVLLG
jgi:hypothetical protein